MSKNSLNVYVNFKIVNTNPLVKYRLKSAITHVASMAASSKDRIIMRSSLIQLHHLLKELGSLETRFADRSLVQALGTLSSTLTKVGIDPITKTTTEPPSSL